MEKAQFRIRRRGDNKSKTCMLIKSCDGYPSEVIPTIKKAYKKYGNHYNALDPRHVSSFIIASDPEHITPGKTRNF